MFRLFRLFRLFHLFLAVWVMLQRQEEARIQKDYDTKQMTKKYEESLREYETRIGIRDQQFFAEKDKVSDE